MKLHGTESVESFSEADCSRWMIFAFFAANLVSRNFLLLHSENKNKSPKSLFNINLEVEAHELLSVT